MGLHPLQAGDFVLQAGVVGRYCLQLHRACFQLQNLGSLLCACVLQPTCKAMLQTHTDYGACQPSAHSSHRALDWWSKAITVSNGPCELTLLRELTGAIILSR